MLSTVGDPAVLELEDDAVANRSWDNLGRAVKPGKGCKVSKKVKITAKSVFRAVLINSKNQATLGYSPRVTVKLK